MKADAAAPSVLILGASGALGRVLVERFERGGYRVLGTGFRRMPKAPFSLRLDATLASEMPKLETWIEEVSPRLDVVIHALGETDDGLLARMSDLQWGRVLEIHLKSAYRISRQLLPRLVRQRGGHFIFVASWAGRAGRAGQVHYAASKAGLIGLMQSMAREYASRGVLANGIVPGIFQSPMTEKLSKKSLERLWDDAVLKQFADLDETARFILHLAGMRGVTGQIFQLDGRIPPMFG